jgi:catechol 2,3-dioxygenase-like lactoylglutathione lyase family enzyme
MTTKRYIGALQFSSFAFLLCALCASSPLLSVLNSSPPAPSAHPKILGIMGVTIYVSDAHSARTFYDMVSGRDPKHPEPSKRCFWCEQPPGFSLNVSLNKFQSISLNPSPSPAQENLIAEVTFWTDNVSALRRHLLENQIEVGKVAGPGVKYLSVLDPEGHKISFIETDGVLKNPKVIAALTRGGYENEIIHTGFVVRDRAVMDHFYKDILGFHVYWHGGMKDDETNWVDMQVPDGTDWIEYMLNVPPNASHKTLGVMNHIALGVRDIHAAHQQLIKNGWKGTEQPKIGRDGKWQLNLYDPDETRVELMEFTPVEKPCCSEYTGPHPKP